MISFPTDILLYVFWSVSAVQLLYFWGLFSRFAFKKVPQRKWTDLPVSVVIVAKNEYHNLLEKLPAILEQEYPEFEVVVVNDGSDDDTELLLKELQSKYSHLNPVHLQPNVNFFYGKKFPLSIGIKSAKYDYLLFTDGDCKPNSKYWINDMVSRFDENKDIVLGYGAYFTRKGILNRIIRYETVNTAIQYFSYALAGIPYMGVGRNLAYKKKLFFDNQGFISHLSVGSGDDDLFIGRVANRRNTAVQFHPDSFTLSEPPQNFKRWWQQKRRHLSTSGYYKPLHRLLLGLYPLTTVLFYALAGVALWLGVNPLLVLVPFVVRMISLYVVYGLSIKKLREEKLLLWLPFLEITWVIFNGLMVFLGLFRKKKRW